MAVTEIRSYLVELDAGDQTANLRATITLFGATKNQIGSLGFVEDGPIPPSAGGGEPVGYYPVARYADALDLLRNERPVYLATDDAGRVWLTTASEPVGEGERLATGFFRFGKAA